MADAVVSRPNGQSALGPPGLNCGVLSLDEVHALPAEFARTAHLAQKLGFGGVELHAAHEFLLNQFLSPLFNKERDANGGRLQNRMRLLLEVNSADLQRMKPSTLSRQWTKLASILSTSAAALVSQVRRHLLIALALSLTSWTLLVETSPRQEFS